MLVLAAVFLTGCAVSPPPTPSPPPVGTIELAVDSAEGAALAVTRCSVEGGGLFPCSLDLRMTFSVVLNSGVDRALVQTISILPVADMWCHQDGIASVTAGTPATLTASSVYFGLQGSATLPECGFPLQTTRIVAQLWRVDISGLIHVLLTQEFSKTYTFTNP